MKKYFEAHITMEGHPDVIRNHVLGHLRGWRFSAIDGDPNFGDGVKCYATRQINLRVGERDAMEQLLRASSDMQKLGVKVVRRKIELVIFDDKTDKVSCVGNCPECVE